MYKENLVTTSDLVKKYGVTRKSIQFWRDKGMPYIRLSPRIFLYNLYDVENWYRNYKLNSR